MATKTPNTIEFAGDYDLNHVFLHNHLKEITDIKKMMEDIKNENPFFVTNVKNQCGIGKVEGT